MNNTKDKIMDLAEEAIIRGGYNAFSFRDIADKIGIKSASVHYHFATKADLAANIMLRYTERFKKRLPNPSSHQPQKLLQGYINGFREQIVERQNMSLCTRLASDSNILPKEVAEELADFYKTSLNWLSEVSAQIDGCSEQQANIKAKEIFASLHGASLLVQATGDISMYTDVVSKWLD